MDSDIKRAVDAGHVAKPNTILLDPATEYVGAFTVYRNGIIRKEVDDLLNPNARTFRVVAVRMAGNAIRASAQPVDIKPPPWWGHGYVRLVKSFMAAQQGMFQEQTETRWDVTPGNAGGTTARTPIDPGDKYKRGRPKRKPGAWTEDEDT